MKAQISAHNVGIRFVVDRQRRPVTPAMERIRHRLHGTWALRGLDFEVEPGAGLALLGANGAGKSTLLRLMAHVLAPDEGTISVRGRVGSLLSVEAGLIPALTGRENALLLGVLSGLPRAKVLAELELIKERSGLDDAFERLVSTYSQGMRARLGFSVIERADPDVLLLDEVHEAIDEAFRHRLLARARAIRERGGIVVAAGHDHAELGRLCDRGLLLDRSGARPVSDLSDSAELVASGVTS